jgi:protein-S-isoprenylcysteine O-methyltransferase Ste14
MEKLFAVEPNAPTCCQCQTAAGLLTKLLTKTRKPAWPSTSRQDAGSKRLIAVGQGLSAFAPFSIAASVPSGRLPHRFSLFWVGLVAIIVGSLLRRHCWRILGANFTGAVIVRSKQHWNVL